jgi:ABC-type antimicrobial peptide transport system permease subunit
MFEWVFAFLHFFLFLGLLLFSVYSIIRGQWFSGLLLLAFLVAYYLVVLQAAVKKEIERKKKKKKKKTG